MELEKGTECEDDVDGVDGVDSVDVVDGTRLRWVCFKLVRLSSGRSSFRIHTLLSSFERKSLE